MFEVIDLDLYVAKEAAILARSRGLRGADSAQLATAAWLARERRDVYFLSFDQQLNRAAVHLMKVLEIQT